MELFPEPFIGRVDAPIVLLNLNPGFDEKSDPNWHRKPIMQEAIEANLTQRPQEYPFYPLSPDFDGSPIAKWWRRLLAPWITQNPDNRKHVAENVLAVELFPYHSKMYGRFAPSRLQGLASYTYSQSLVADAIKRNAKILVLRSQHEWQEAVPGLAAYREVYHLGSSSRSPSLNNPKAHVGKCYDQKVDAAFKALLM